ncbi:MAG: HAMP domain-containing sensor histidine kinase [Victivallales bacterium]|nr:HAMP domain-containing sensor histidine kinase [Victivallales bacterium]
MDNSIDNSIYNGCIFDRNRGVESSRDLFGGSLGEFFNNIPDMVLMLNSQREAVYGNRHLHEFIDRDGSQKIEGRKLGDIFSCVNAEETPGGCGCSSKCEQCGAFRALNEARRNLKASGEYTLNRVGKEEVVFQVWATPLYIYGERFIKFILRNIGEVKRKQQFENVFLRDLSRLSEQLMTRLDYVRENPYSRDTVFEETCSLAHEIHDVIRYQEDLVAAEEDRLELQIGDINSYCLLQDVVHKLQSKLRCQGKEIRINDSSEKIFFRSDGRLLRQIFRHMLGNALQATPSGDYVGAECACREGNIIFRIHDNGFISEEGQRRLFRHYSSVEGVRGPETYSIKLLAEKYLHGKVSCLSSPQQGTTFVVSLPRIEI